MSQQESYPLHPGQQQDGYPQAPEPQAQNYENYETQSPPGVPPAPPQGPALGTRKKRTYAGQAYEFGSGANVPPGAATAAAGYGGFSQQQEAAGYPQGGYQQIPAAVQQGSTPLYGYQDSTGVGNYQSPPPAYPTAGQPATIGQVTQQFSQLDMSQKPAAAPAPRPPVLNQLRPVDIMNQPFNVAELDYPPPLAILPPNVSIDLLPVLTAG